MNNDYKKNICKKPFMLVGWVDKTEEKWKWKVFLQQWLTRSDIEIIKSNLINKKFKEYIFFILTPKIYFYVISPS